MSSLSFQVAPFDVIIIGAGPAGLQAGIYTARAKLSTLIFGSAAKKSQLATVPFIGNYLGFPDGVSGDKLIELGRAHVQKYGATLEDQEVVRVVTQPGSEGKLFEVKTPTATYVAKTIIVASGLGLLHAGIRGEMRYENKGVSYCVICDGYFFQNKKIAVVGNKDFAAEKVVELFNYTKHISLFTQGQELLVSNEMREEMNREQVAFRMAPEEKIVEIRGDETRVRSIVLANGKEEEVDGVFIGAGTASSLSFAKSLGLETSGSFLKFHGGNGTTNVPGVFAAGDCMGAPLQIGKAVGEATIAALGVIKYLRGSSHVDHGKE